MIYFLFANHPLGDGAVRPVPDHQELGRDLAADAREDFDDVYDFQTALEREFRIIPDGPIKS